MNEPKKIVDYILQPELIASLSMEQIDLWIEESPYMQSLYLMKAIKIRSNGGVDPKLYHKIATVVTDRIRLSEIIENPIAQPEPPIEENDKVVREDLSEALIGSEMNNSEKDVLEKATELSSEQLENLENSAKESTSEEGYLEASHISENGESKHSNDSKIENQHRISESETEFYLQDDRKNDVELSEFSKWLLALRKTSSEEIVDEERVDRSVKQNEEVISETLANLLLNQGHKEDAIKMYHKLGLINPEKSTYFAHLIEKLSTK